MSKFYTKTLSLFFLQCFFFINLGAQIYQVEPPNWWTGMKSPKLQIMVHAKGVALLSPEIHYPGLEMAAVSKLESENYLFIDLILSPEIKAGKFDILFKEGQKTKYRYNYELKTRRESSRNLAGYDNSDVIYLITPDRFANGDPSNDSVDGLTDKLNRKDPYGRHGGDLRGIIDHLDYISDMGFTAIWLNPVLENNQPESSYHGYAITDFYQVDKRFGRNEEYLELADKAREKGLGLVMDMVFNHCGSEHWWMKDLPSEDWINNYPDIKITNHRRTANQDPYASQYDLELLRDGWFVTAMPDMNQRNPFMAKYHIQNSIWWTENLGLAGIRMDTYPYPDKYMLSEWNRRMLEEYPDINIIGEEWSTNPVVVSYWQGSQEKFDAYKPNMPGVLDFPLQHSLAQGLIEEESWSTGLVKLYEILASDHLYTDPFNLVIFPDNHDMARMFMQLNKNIDLYKMAIAYILTTRGIPQIYYGSEILMTHPKTNEHGDIRSDWPGGWPGDKVNAFTGQGLSEEQADMQNYLKKLLHYRKENEVLQTGRLMHFAPDNGMYVYFRYKDDKTVMVILNKNKAVTPLDMSRFQEIVPGKTTALNILSGKTISVEKTLEVPAVSALILEFSAKGTEN
jgi:glycosidase